MKKKEIFLDFTPLLDITLIILFFFILFSSMEVVDQKEKLDQQNEKIRAELAGKEDQLNDALAMIETEDSRRASNIQAMIDFNRGFNLKLILDMNDNTPSIRVLRGDEAVTTLHTTENLAALLSQALAQSGYSANDTIFCDFILDGSQPGTAATYRSIKKELSQLKRQYPYFYDSETDTSTGKDE